MRSSARRSYIRYFYRSFLTSFHEFESKNEEAYRVQNKNAYEIQESTFRWKGALITFSKRMKTWENISHFENTTMLDQIKQTILIFRVLPDFHERTVFLLVPGGGLSTWNIGICNVYTFYNVFRHWRALNFWCISM